MTTTKTTRFGAGIAVATLSATLFASLVSSPALGHGDPHGPLTGPEHGPIGVMQDHMHNKGEWMASARYKHMEMGGNRNGTTRLTNEEVLARFMMAPQAMKMNMYMVGGMYGLTDKVTVMASMSYMTKDGVVQNRAGMNMDRSADGFGDVKIAALFSLFKNKNHRMHINAGLSLPTGSVSGTRALPNGGSVPKPYPMQIGSGTWDLMPGITYAGKGELFYWGAQVRAVIRTGKNKYGYRKSDSIMATSWLMARLNDALDMGFRVAVTKKSRIRGADARLNPMMMQTANPALFGGEKVEAFFGINYQFQQGTMRGHRFGVEVGMPVYQNLNGPQMEADWSLMTGWQKSF